MTKCANCGGEVGEDFALVLLVFACDVEARPFCCPSCLKRWVEEFLEEDER